MDFKTFEAFSMKDAVKAVKKGLGSEAVILSTREKSAPGGKGTIYELTAAAPGFRKVGASGPRAQATSVDYEAGLDHIQARLSALVDVAATRTQVQAVEAGLQELKLQKAQEAAAKKAARTAPSG